MKIDLMWARGCALSVCVLTSACGGGGDSGGVTSTPAPPSPTYATIDQTSTSVSLKLATVAISYTDTDTGASPAVRSDVKLIPVRGVGDGPIYINYDAATRTYMVSDDGVPFTYAVASGNNPNQGMHSFYNESAIHSDSILIDQKLNSGYLTYSAFIGTYRQDHSAYGSDPFISKDKKTLSVGGIETLASDMPKSGTAIYNLTFRAYVNDAQLNPVRNAFGGMEVDFAKASVSTDMSFQNDKYEVFGVFKGTAAFDTSSVHFKGDLTSDGVTKGSFVGGFYGPQAAEAGYVFRVTTSAGVVDGAALGRKN